MTAFIKYKRIPLSEDNIGKYKSSDNMLIHARPNDDNNNGYMLVNKFNNDELIAYISFDNDRYCTALETSSKYRGRGIATHLLNKNRIDTLSVSKNNENAISLYDKLGFSETEDFGKQIEMKRDL